MQTYPSPTGLYDPRFEHDSCGVSFVAHMRGVASNELVQTGLRALTNLEHRGATGAEPDTGDGAGILIQVPDACSGPWSVSSSRRGRPTRWGSPSCPFDDVPCEKAQAQIEAIMADEGLTVLGWREMPVDPTCLGDRARGDADVQADLRRRTVARRGSISTG
jgi:glutamate synthase (NADPH) large chain